MVKRRIGSLISALALMIGALVIAAAPAQATPQVFQPPYEVSFSPEKPACDGVVDVATTNNLDERFHIGLTFKVNSVFVNVDPETTEHTLVNYPDSQNITVKLVGLYEADDDDSPVLSESAAAKRSDVAFTELQKEWNYQWERPDGCWKNVAKFLCGGDIQLDALNTSPAPGWIVVQPDTTDAVEILVAGNAHFVATYHAETVSITQDKKTTTYNWKDPGGCVTPSPVPPPAPEPQNGGQAPNLPETGASLTGGMIWSSSILLIALIAAGVGGVLAWRRSRRSQQTTA